MKPMDLEKAVDALKKQKIKNPHLNHKLRVEIDDEVVFIVCDECEVEVARMAKDAYYELINP